MRLIDADAYIHEYRDWLDSAFGEEAHDEIIESIEEFPSVDTWILCSERIPEKYRFVLVCRKRGGWFIADWDGKNWHTDGYLEIEGNGIAAWMPLPKLWKDET